MATVREIRKQRKLTQAELAELAGVGLSTIIRLEKGRDVNPATIKAIARVLKTPVSAIDDVKVLSRVPRSGVS